MVSVGLGQLLEGLRVVCKDTRENSNEGIAGEPGEVMGISQVMPNGEVTISVRLDGEQEFRDILARNLSRE